MVRAPGPQQQQQHPLSPPHHLPAAATPLTWWYTSLPICIASLNDDAPVGRIMNS